MAPIIPRPTHGIAHEFVLRRALVTRARGVNVRGRGELLCPGGSLPWRAGHPSRCVSGLACSSHTNSRQYACAQEANTVICPLLPTARVSSSKVARTPNATVVSGVPHPAPATSEASKVIRCSPLWQPLVCMCGLAPTANLAGCRGRQGCSCARHSLIKCQKKVRGQASTTPSLIINQVHAPSCCTTHAPRSPLTPRRARFPSAAAPLCPP